MSAEPCETPSVNASGVARMAASRGATVRAISPQSTASRVHGPLTMGIVANSKVTTNGCMSRIAPVLLVSGTPRAACVRPSLHRGTWVGPFATGFMMESSPPLSFTGAQWVPGLLPARPGPRRPHKLSDEVVETLSAAKSEQPELTADDLVELVRTRFGISIHRRSIDRALVREKKRR